MLNIDADFIQSQKEYLEDLIAFKAHPFTLDAKDKIGWQDWDHGPLAYVKRQDIISVLRKVASNELTLRDYYDWSNSIIGRDTVRYEKGFKGVIDDVLSCIIPDYESTYLETPPTQEFGREYAENLIKELQSAQFDPAYDYDDE